MDVKKVLLFLCSCLLEDLSTNGNFVLADECGTRFTDFTSSAVLAQIVLKGSIKDFNPTSRHSQVRSANVTVKKVFKGMDVLKEFNRSVEQGDNIVVHHFGIEDKDNCIAPYSEEAKGQERVFFLRQSSHRGMLRLSAMPVAAQSNMDRRVRRSLCDTCVRPPKIKRLVCPDCAKEPTIKAMKSKQAKIGRRARLRCIARGRPTPAITWAKGNIPLVSGTGAFIIRTSGTTSILVINRVSNAHSGRYKCIATNDIGQTEEVVSLNVTRKSRPSYTIESAPDREQCLHNPCLNGGSCIYSPSLDLRRCLCTRGFEGVQCENTDNQNISTKSTTAAPTTTTTTTSTIQSLSSSKLEDTKSTTVITSSTTLSTTLSRLSSSNIAERHIPIPRLPGTSRSTGQIDPRYPISRKSSLKIIPCREKNYCMNRGKCRYISKLRKKFCKCRSGFFGNRCEKKL